LLTNKSVDVCNQSSISGFLSISNLGREIGEEMRSVDKLRNDARNEEFSGEDVGSRDKFEIYLRRINNILK
jgi:hypothetical protein